MRSQVGALPATQTYDGQISRPISLMPGCDRKWSSARVPPTSVGVSVPGGVVDGDGRLGLGMVMEARLARRGRSHAPHKTLQPGLTMVQVRHSHSEERPAVKGKDLAAAMEARRTVCSAITGGGHCSNGSLTEFVSQSLHRITKFMTEI